MTVFQKVACYWLVRNPGSNWMDGRSVAVEHIPEGGDSLAYIAQTAGTGSKDLRPAKNRPG